jgi:hypothetical protein
MTNFLLIPETEHELTQRKKLPSNFLNLLEQGKWRDATGRVWELLTMEEDHLKNCVGWLQSKLTQTDEQIRSVCTEVASDPMLMQGAAGTLLRCADDQAVFERAVLICKKALIERNEVRSAQVEARTLLEPVVAVIIEE